MVYLEFGECLSVATLIFFDFAIQTFDLFLKRCLYILLDSYLSQRYSLLALALDDPHILLCLLPKLLYLLAPLLILHQTPLLELLDDPIQALPFLLKVNEMLGLLLREILLQLINLKDLITEFNTHLQKFLRRRLAAVLLIRMLGTKYLHFDRLGGQNYIDNLYWMQGIAIFQLDCLLLSVMNIEIARLEKQLHAREEEHRRDRSILVQKIELLQAEIGEYQEKESKNRQVNQSIMMSYKQNQSFIEQYTQKQMNTLTQRHQDQLKTLKRRHNDEKKRLQEEINNLKCETDKLKLDIQRIHLDQQKQIAEIRNQYEDKLKEKDNDMNNIYQHRLELMNERLRQSQEMNSFFKSQLETKKDKSYINIQEKTQEIEKENKRLSVASKKNQECHQILRRNQESVSSINLRINRALVQLQPNKVKLDDKLRKIRERIYDDRY